MSQFAKTLILGLSVGVLVLGPSVHAEEAKAKEKHAPVAPEVMLAKLDKDKDGKLSLEEFLAKAKSDKAKEALTAKFKMADGDSDNVLSLEEYTTTTVKAPHVKKESNKKGVE